MDRRAEVRKEWKGLKRQKGVDRKEWDKKGTDRKEWKKMTERME
jgi:hypothetical protein